MWFWIRTTVLAVALAATVLTPTASVSGQTPWRPACELIDAAEVSAIVGGDVRPELEGPRNACRFEGSDREVTIEVLARADVNDYGGDDARDLVIAGRQAVELQSGAIVALDDGGTLSASVVRIASGEGVGPRKLDRVVHDGDSTIELYRYPRSVRLATDVLEAILGAGPVTTQPPSRGEPGRLGPAGPMCDLLAVDDLNEILGTTFASTDMDSSDYRCHVSTTPGFFVDFELDYDDMNAIDIGTYTSEELDVAGRPARWDPVDNGYPTLDVDAGGGDLFRVYYQMEDRPAGLLREPAIAIAEAVIPRLATVGAPPTIDCSTLTIEEVASATGLSIVSADGSTGDGCAYGVTGAAGSFLVSVIPEEVAASFGMTLPDPERTEVAGHPAAASSVPGGAALMVDIDGLPGMTGYVMLVIGADFPEDVDPLAAIKGLAEVLMSKL